MRATTTDAANLGDQLDRYRRLFEEAPLAYHEADVDGVIRRVNRAECRLLGLAESEILGRCSWDFAIPAHRQAMQDRFRSFMAGEEITGALEFDWMRADGALRTYAVYPSRITDAAGAVIGSRAARLDVTAQKEAARALDEQRRLAQLHAVAISALASADPIAWNMQRCSEALVRYVGAEFAGVWTVNRTASELELKANAWRSDPAGRYDRIPMGQTIVGRVAAKLRSHLTNQILKDPWLGDPVWIRHAGITAFAGHPLIVDGELAGVLAIFARESFSDVTFQALGSVAQEISRGIERKSMEVAMHSAQRLESIGQLAAGIAHEINTPIQYVGDNARFLQNACAELAPLIDLDRAADDKRDDMQYLCREIPKAIEQLLEGVEQVARIVSAMKEFSHPGPPEKTAFDLNRAVQSTILVARNEWKYVADMVENLEADLPQALCVAGEINQVLLNLIVNAGHAIAAAGKSEKGVITVSTGHTNTWVEIRVQDTGTGIPMAIRSKVFDPFFTTKEVGKGTGQGLSIVHTVVVKNHGGTVHFETETGVGTTFVVRLPWDPRATG